MFGKILNMLLNWLLKLKMIDFKISSNIKGRRQRLIAFIFVTTIQYAFSLNSKIRSTIHTNGSHHHFFIEITILGYVLSILFTNSCSAFNENVVNQN